MSRELDLKVSRALGYVGKHDQEGQQSLLRYSTRLSPAWELVEWMRGRGWYFILRVEDEGCTASFGLPEWSTDDLYQTHVLPTGKASEKEEAICLAFLKAGGKWRLHREG